MCFVNNSISNERLEVSFRLPRNIPYSKRFDAAGCISEIVLDGKHVFCEPEQIISGRPDTHGLGLCGEFKWDELGEEVKKGGYYPKLGVGIIKQVEDFLPFNDRRDSEYEVSPFDTVYSIENSQASFFQTIRECNGISAKIQRKYSIVDNSIELETTIENIGKRTIDCYEYQHNFVSIDQIPIGPGYHLKVPFDNNISSSDNYVGKYRNLSEKIAGVLSEENGIISWNKNMDGIEFSRVVETEEINNYDNYYWELTNDFSSASIKEEITISPKKMVYWAIEHCICVEMYIPITVIPNSSCVFKRKWTFSD